MCIICKLSSIAGIREVNNTLLSVEIEYTYLSLHECDHLHVLGSHFSTPFSHKG